MAPDPPGFFPPTTTINPLSPPHKNTIILLHGRGFSAETFGPALVSTTFPSISSSLTTLQTAHPHTKFLLPLAPRHRATIYKRSIIHQWFDSWHLNQNSPTDTEEWRVVPALRDTIAYVHGLVRQEAALVGGVGNVMLGGMSQGCAASLMALLLWEGEALGGYLGMFGWLVFEREAKRVLLLVAGGGGEKEEEEEQEFDPFERDENERSSGDEEEEEAVGVEARVVRLLREQLELEGAGAVTSRPKSFDTPVFLGHGTDDDKVPFARGREAAECLKAAGLDVQWQAYPGLAHWYSADMLKDMSCFMTDRAGWERPGDTGTM
ncbi:Alpha/Beta hydrolase protein [Chaetomidium leptoderma]|uniref:Alpha/Beta hydrolase protein n=1 Tax=Chaetomidium leptoderma TaxID=669021 RepID=A0AAN6VWQ4_9PEZI|nr:Alpha/Beta hydrolase protein [Chaetomidium leptoderma]